MSNELLSYLDAYFDEDDERIQQRLRDLSLEDCRTALYVIAVVDVVGAAEA